MAGILQGSPQQLVHSGSQYVPEQECHDHVRVFKFLKI